MKPIAKQSNRKRAFTIIELLTVMSIIVILIGLLVPALNNVRRYAKKVKQKAQFHSMDAAIELFNNEFDGYPSSGSLDSSNPPQPYCGAEKLCEAMMGQDLIGFHSNSVFRRDGRDIAGIQLYGLDPSDPLYEDNLKARIGPFLPSEGADAYRLEDIYGTGNTGSLRAENFVLCDVYTREMSSGTKTGMPILYYKAETANNLHRYTELITPIDSDSNIYNYYDNQILIELGKPWLEAGSVATHRLLEGIRFYKNTQNEKITTTPRPYRAETFILISAGFDGEYGTADDVCNFDWKYEE